MQVAARRANLFAVIEALSIVAFLAMTAITWAALNESADRSELLPSYLTATLLIGSLVPAMAILVLLGRRMALRRAAETSGGTGQMHVRLVFFFSLIASIPTLLVVIFASWLFQSGVEFWFSDSSRGLLENANKLARGYYGQAQRDVGYESLGMAGDIGTYLSQGPITSPRFAEGFSYQVLNRKLTEAAILQRGPDGSLSTAAIVVPEGKPSENKIPAQTLDRLAKGEPMVVTANANKIEAVVPIDRETGVYLYTARSSDLLAFSQGQRAENIVQAYEVLTRRARVLQLRFNVALFVASLALVGLSVWFALRFADRQVKPLYELVDAARRVGSGNFALRILGRTGSDEIGLLNRAFNRMTAQIEKQTQALLGANQQLQERRAFIEAVLESVTSGIISIDGEGHILLINSTAQKLLLDPGEPGPVGLSLGELAPQIAALAESDASGGIVQYNKHGELLTLAIKTSRDRTGHVITFEDITRQLLDQRQAAWSDVARRIAHEIKNPLTPIQLATERLSRRYRKQIVDNPELFEDLTRTIIRQVGDLRKMVDEFSSFARLPKPVFRAEDPVSLTRQALFLQEVARPDIAFAFTSDPGIGRIACDRHQFGQAMTNVLKNAVEAIETKEREADEGYSGRIAVEVREAGESILVRITDNGIGLSQDRERIIEPYVTTREKGTGLGLAIVNKIVEEHGGEMTFTPAQGGGTTVTMRFAADPLHQGRSSEAAE
ncbi:sensor histidine kinase [Novosphingobium album (ex Liu et al. 2023)]|uniref:histidine kinase n=1 Tax=Novosphingobium album (ex Liu et al. 2023) TaxID=3031130 RepID=A0ABT5WVE2_9SPHN|nr:ATP-binding protein [Novosphingobium album (ex Liu et al. 2023)]MDE8653874.1 ATP-binding protein [Novosphingobium album (ex Liu et al. 2023)]